MTDLVCIYGFVRGRKFYYVGQAFDLSIRRRTHNRQKLGKAGVTRKCRMVLIRKASLETVNRIEGQIISALKRRGQCQLNSKIPRRGVKSLTIGTGTKVKHIPTGRIFMSYSHAAREVGGCCGATIANDIKRGCGNYVLV